MASAIVVGAGPLGATLSYILANNGIDVTLIERQQDFAREFRGEVLMPSGVAALRQAGLGTALDGVPFTSVNHVEINRGAKTVLDIALADLVAPGTEIRITPQPILLEAIVGAAQGEHFTLERRMRVRDLVIEDGRVVGVTAERDGESAVLRGDIVIGADGRGSTVRKKAGLHDIRESESFDVVWYKAQPPPSYQRDPKTRFFLGDNHFMICIPQHDGRLQIGWVIRKGGFGELHSRGIDHWIRQLADHVSRELADHLIANANQVSDPFLLNVVCYCLPRWTKPGLLLIGDAAHPMSPVGAQGLNIALRDAIVAANHLIPALIAGGDSTRIDAAASTVERERRPEIETVQRFQRRAPRVLFGRPAVTATVLALAPLAAAFPPTRRLIRRDADRLLNGVARVELDPSLER